MVWLDGKPTLVKTLAWPADDSDLKRKLRCLEQESWSVLDDQILFSRSFAFDENRTVIYMANTTSARDTQADTIIMERVAELNYAAHRVAVVPDVGFVTAVWCNSGIHFRAHSGTGELLRERHCPAQASYGYLSVLGPTVSLCMSSTDTVPPNWEGVSSYIHYYRLDYVAGLRPSYPIDLEAETIVTWNADTGDLHLVEIPQDPQAQIRHYANLQYISPHKIVLASSLAFNPRAAVLCAFSANAEDQREPLKFYQGQHTDPDMVSDNLGYMSTSTPGPIIVHNHDSEGRITIFKTELLSGDIPSSVTTRDPPGMRDASDYPNDARTLGFSVSCLPSVAVTRVLVNRRDNYGSGVKIFVLDFDQTLLASLLTKQPSERANWNAELVDARAQVKVVTRRYHYGIGGEIYDDEYPWPQRAPPEWEAHLDTILKQNEDEDEDVDDSDGSSNSDFGALPSGVEYDEAPEEHREPVPFGFVQTALRLEGVTDADSLALTKHAILELSDPTENGRVFYFD